MRLPPERLFLYLPFLSDKRPVSRGQLVLVFCTLLDDLNALVTWRSHSSPARSEIRSRFSAARGPSCTFPRRLHRCGTSPRGQTRSSHFTPASQTFSWVAAKVKALAHPSSAAGGKVRSRKGVSGAGLGLPR